VCIFGVSTDKVVPADYDGDGKHSDLGFTKMAIQALLVPGWSTAGFVPVGFGTTGDNTPNSPVI